MKKKIDITSINNELRGASAFFRQPTQEHDPPLPSSEDIEQSNVVDTKISEDTITPRYHDTVHNTTIPRHRDTTVSLQAVRRAVKQYGKEAGTHRLTLEEKRTLQGIEHAYLSKSIRTSENEMTRISINYILEDYKVNGDESILARVLELLHS